MIEVPEPETELKPIPKPPYKPTITDKAVKVPILVMSNATLADKVSANPWWVGFKHFLYGAILAGGARPQPARFGLVDLRPEPLMECRVGRKLFGSHVASFVGDVVRGLAALTRCGASSFYSEGVSHAT